MDEEHLVQDDSLRVDAALLTKMRDSSFAAIDRGSTLTKILYTVDIGDGNYDLHFATFRNKHFESGVELSDEGQAATQCDRRLHVTGVGSNLYGDRIKETLGVNTVFIDEAASQFVGFYFSAASPAPGEPSAILCRSATTPYFDQIQRGGETFQRLRDARVREDGSIEVKHRHLLAGKSFLGACPAAVVGTGDYQRVLDMAAAGEGEGTSTRSAARHPRRLANSPYGKMPGHNAVLPVRQGRGLLTSRWRTAGRRTLPSLIVSSFIINFMNVVTYSWLALKGFATSSLGATFSSTSLPAQEVSVMSFNFLKTGHTAALGAALASPSDVVGLFRPP
uniref:Ppx-GppA domain-containing protein n=1 Tax=Macrostomum lignano TaxID=282301 RepID=A0A1I8FDF2_9PLAT